MHVMPRCLLLYCWRHQEVDVETIDTNSAYILFYERRGLDCSKYMPDVNNMAPDFSDIDDECDNEIKKVCSIQ